MPELLQDSLSGNDALVFAVALFFSAISGQKMEASHRVTLIYSYCLMIVYFDIVDFGSAVLGSSTVLFLVFEVFNSDQMLLHLFNFGYKLGDALFRLFIECYGWLFYPLLWACSSCQGVNNPLVQLAFFLSVVYLATLTSRSRFSTQQISQIVEKLESIGGRPARHAFDRDDWRKLELLIFLEDGGFSARGERTHVITLRYACSRVAKRLGRDGLALIEGLARNPRSLKSYIRGYSTLEMQIMRNVGLQFGSDCLVARRKIFEYYYSQAVFNSYAEQFSKTSVERERIKEWILHCYLNLVSVKVGGSICSGDSDGTTFDKLFDKSFSSLSLEEFFVWCLGLPHYRLGVGENAVAIHRDAVELFNLDLEAVYGAIALARRRIP